MVEIGDGNNTFFHASMKTRNNVKSLEMIYNHDNTAVNSDEGIEEVILQYYESLIGTKGGNLQHIDIGVMRARVQLNFNQRGLLTRPVTERDVTASLKGINDLKSLGLDGFGARFFKSSWHIVKHGVMAAILEFFEQNQLYRAFKFQLHNGYTHP